MRVLTWNLRRARQNSEAWDLFASINPDIALLQEVGDIPLNIKNSYESIVRRATSKTGRLQHFSTAILVRGQIIVEQPLSSNLPWVNRELEFFAGNFISCVAKTHHHESLRLVSIYSPAWPVNNERLRDVDISSLQLKGNKYLWPTEILWSALKNTIKPNGETWIVAGDYNASETFDIEYQNDNKVRYGIRSYGNKEILNRMKDIGLTECLRKHHGDVVPTFKDAQSGKLIHQIDHLFVTKGLLQKLIECDVGDKSFIFDQNLSDHLPIIADFES